MAKEQLESKSMLATALEFPGESIAELKKVHSPSRQEVTMLTIRVLMMVALFGVFLGLTDLIVGSLMRHILT